MIYQLDSCGYIPNVGQSFDVRTKTGAYAGLISENFKNGMAKVYFNSNATRGSSRKFQSVESALDFIHARRVKKGWA